MDRDSRALGGVRFSGRKKGKRLPGLDKTPKEPPSRNLLENLGHEIPKNGQMIFARDPASMVSGSGRKKLVHSTREGNVVKRFLTPLRKVLEGKFVFQGSFGEGPGANCSSDRMKDYLESLGQANKDMIMILKFDRKGKYVYMVDILDEINRAAIEKRYSFAKMNDEDLRVLESVGG